MQILLFGKNGQLGSELHRCLSPLGQVQALDYPEIDLANQGSLRALLQASKPDIVVNATAYTAVDRAENERELAYAINATGPAVIADEAKALGAVFIHYSTDYVFDGKKGKPYDEADTPNPLNVYGTSKLAGEQAIQAVSGANLILRTAWVYSLQRDSFVTKVLQWARKNETLKIVDDQVSNPTWARMLAQITALLLARGPDYISERAGLYHLAGDGHTSRLDWTRQILMLDPKSHEQITRELIPAATTDFPTPAERPLFSAMNCAKFYETFRLCLPQWDETLSLAMNT